MAMMAMVAPRPISAAARIRRGRICAIPTPAFVRTSANCKSGKCISSAPTAFASRSYNTNRYERFRRCILSASSDLDSQSAIPSIDRTKLIDVGRSTFEVLSTNRRTYNRIWKRMGPLLDLIVDCSIASQGKLRSVADVGCDHGMLSLSLAGMAWVASLKCYGGKGDNCDDNGSFRFFSRVFGTDASERALADGGLASLERMTATLAPILQCEGQREKELIASVPLPIEFRLGCGLEPLQPSEADAVVLAGMGVHTMLEILFGSNEEMAPVDSVQSQYLFLQPTNSRPQHMVILYDRLQQSSGWTLRDERVAFVGGRWYISSVFERCKSTGLEPENAFRFPGHCLTPHSGDGDAYDTYVRHHLQWLKEDFERPQCSLEDEDMRWLQHIISSDERWRSQVNWLAPQ